VSANRDRPRPELVEAAQALLDELERFASASREAQRLPLESHKNLERTAASLGELAGADRRIEPALQRLLAALGEIGARQQAEAERIRARAEELQRRREAYARLLERQGALGVAAQELNRGLQALPRVRGEDGRESVEPEALERLRNELSSLVQGAQELVEAARAVEFEDLARESDALRQALLSARNRLGLLAARTDS
jgi:hypothetical protein